MKKWILLVMMAAALPVGLAIAGCAGNGTTDGGGAPKAMPAGTASYLVTVSGVG